MGNLVKKLYKNIIFLILVFSIPAVWALLVPGFYGASDDLHIGWLYQMHRTLMMGQIPPRFVPDLSFGFGYPLFNFVFPLPFYIAELFHLFGFSLVDSIKLLFLLTIPFSGIFMFAFLKQFTNKYLSLFGAILYIYTPYRSTDIYVRGAIGEILSFAILPLIALSVTKLSNGERINIRWVGIGSLALAALVLSHNITAYMFMPFIMLLWVLRIFFSVGGKFKSIILLISTIFLGLMISIYFWLPALIDSSLMRYDTVFNFSDHFPTLKQLITPYWGYGASVPGPYDGMSFFLGIVNIALIIFAIFSTAYFFKKYTRNQKILLFWAFCSFFISIFFMNYRSTYIWQNLPLLPFFQFPWRFLIMTTFLTPLFVINLEVIKKSWVVSASLIFITLISTGSFFRPHDFLGRNDDYFLNRYIPVPVASQEYLKTAEEYLRLTRKTEKRPEKNFQLVSSDNGMINNITYINDLHTIIDVSSKNGMVLNYNKYLFPGWKTLVDGSFVEIKAGSPYGQIIVSVPEGDHKVEIKFEEVEYKKLLNSISLAAFLVSLLMLKNLWFRSRKTGPSFLA